MNLKTLILRVINYKSNVKSLYLHPIGEFISDQIRTQRIHYELDLLTKIRFLVNYQCFIDVGANIGNHSNYFSSYGARGWAFEPSTENYKLLALNAVNFSTIKAALGSDQSEVEIYTFHNAMGNSHVVGAIDSSLVGKVSNIEIVNLCRLDDFDISCATLVKIDTEGFEVEVLKGAKRTLERFSPALWIEVHQDVNLIKSNARYVRSDIMKILMENGYFYYHQLDKTNYLFCKRRKFFMRRISKHR